MYIIYIYIYTVYIYIYIVCIYIYILIYYQRKLPMKSLWPLWMKWCSPGSQRSPAARAKGALRHHGEGPHGGPQGLVGSWEPTQFYQKKRGGCLTNKYGGFKINYQQIWWFCQQTIDFTKKNTKNGVQPTVRPDKNACRSLQCSRSFVSNVSHVCKCKSRYPSITSRMCANAREDILA